MQTTHRTNPSTGCHLLIHQQVNTPVQLLDRGFKAAKFLVETSAFFSFFIFLTYRQLAPSSPSTAPPLPISDPQDENKIGIDGIQQFCDDLSLDPASITVLVVAWKFRAATQCEFSKKEFLDGMTELGWVSTSTWCPRPEWVSLSREEGPPINSATPATRPLSILCLLGMSQWTSRSIFVCRVSKLGTVVDITLFISLGFIIIIFFKPVQVF